MCNKSYADCKKLQISAGRFWIWNENTTRENWDTSGVIATKNPFRFCIFRKGFLYFICSWTFFDVKHSLVCRQLCFSSVCHGSQYKQYFQGRLSDKPAAHIHQNKQYRRSPVMYGSSLESSNSLNLLIFCYH